MKQEAMKHITIIDIINTAMTSNNKPKSLTQSHSTPDISVAVLSELTYSNIWNVFSKWCADQTHIGYRLNIFPFATIFYTKSKSIEGIMLRPSDYFIKEHKLKWDDECNSVFLSYSENQFRNESTSQMQKINYIALSSELNSPKIVVQNGLINLFSAIGELLEGNQFCLVDLGVLGQLKYINRVLIHLPSRGKSQGDEIQNKKTTIKSMMNKDSMRECYNNSTMKRSASQADIIDYDRNNYKERERERILKQSQQIASTTNMLKGSMSTTKIQGGLPPIKLIKNDRIIYLPIEDSQWQIKDMINVTFKVKSMKKPIANPVLFNCFSNTKAAPFTAEKTQIPLTHRIGSFYSQSIQNLILDKNTKTIKRLYDDYFYKYKNIPIDEPASELEEYIYLIHPEEIEEQKIISKQKTYQRYLDFINSSIPEDSIADIKKEWLVNIARRSHRQYNINSLDRYDIMLNSFIRETVIDYKNSMKTSILDYILKHPEQREKLGINIQFRRIKEYAEETVERPSDNDYHWKKNWNCNKLLISNNLFIYGKKIIKIIDIFVKKLSRTSYYDLIENDVSWPTLKLNNFMDNQRQRLESQYKAININWKVDTESFLKVRPIFKDQFILFLNAVCGLMSSQLRKLIVNSISQFHRFIKEYKKDTYYTAKEIFNKQFTTAIPFQKSFIEIEIQESEDLSHYVFSENLSDIHMKLTNTVREVIRHSQNIERPDNIFIKKSEKKGSLWQVPFDDSVVSEMYQEIDSVISENLEIISKVTELYQPYEFVINEQKRIKEFNDSCPKREDYTKKIKFYEEKLSKAINELQDFLYMNMIKINCVEINATIRKKLYSCVTDLLNSIKKVNIIDKSKELGSSCEKLMQKFECQNPTEEQIYQLEADLEEYRENTVPDLFVQYEDFMEWIFFYLKYDTYNVLEPEKDNLNSIEHNVSAIYGIFNKIEQNLKQFAEVLETSKKKLTDALDVERGRVQKNITDVKAQVDDCRDHISSKILSDDSTQFLMELQDLHTRAKENKSDLESLTKKEGFLGNAFITEDERVEQCLIDILPIINYLEFINEYKDILKTEKEEIFTLNFPALINLIDQFEIFDVSIQKIPSYKGKIQKAKGEFERFKQTVDYCRLIAPLVDIFKYEGIEETNTFTDNMFYCSQLGEYLPMLNKYSPEETQNAIRQLKLKDILMSGQLMDQFTKGRLDIEKIVTEWQNVMSLYELQGKMLEDIDIEFKTESYQGKSYLIIKHECMTTMLNILNTYIAAIEEKVTLFDSPKEELIIMNSVIDYKKKFVVLIDVINELQSTQLKLEEFMDRAIVLKKKPEGFTLLKMAESKYEGFIDIIKDQKLKMIELLQPEVELLIKEILVDLSKWLIDIGKVNDELKKNQQQQQQQQQA